MIIPNSNNTIRYCRITTHNSTITATAFDLTISTLTLTYKVVKNGINTPFTIYATIKKGIVLK